MNVPEENKVNLLTVVLPFMIRALAAKVPAEAQVSADDIVDLLSLGIAAVMANDSNLVVPSQRRKAVENVGRRMLDQVKALDQYRDAYGQSYLSSILDGPLVPPGAAN